MNLKFPITNPIRFYSNSLEPDFESIFPTVHNEQIGTEYYEAMRPLPFLRTHVKDTEISWLVEGVLTSSFAVYKNGVNIDDANESVLIGTLTKLTYNLSEGYWQFRITQGDDIWISDYILVIPNNNRIIKVEGWDLGFRHGAYFGGNINSPSYSVLSYYTGDVIPKVGTTFIDQYKADPNTIINVEIEPSIDWSVTIEVHKSYLKHILYLFSLNKIKINNKFVILKGEIKSSQQSNSDVFVMQLEVQIENSNYYD